MTGRYVFLEATEEEKAQAEMLEKGLDGPKKVYWRLPEALPDSPNLKKFEVYHQDLIKFNSKINLISKKSVYDADILHFLDSVLASQKILEDTQSDVIYDFGSGNGFPGLIMAIMAPDRKFILIDSDSRKIEFIKHMVTKLVLKNVATHNIDVANFTQPKVQCAVARGFASITKALLISRKALLPQGCFYHMKGPLWSNEVGELPSQLLGLWKPSLLSEYKLSNDLGQRFIVKTEYQG